MFQNLFSRNFQTINIDKGTFFTIPTWFGIFECIIKFTFFFVLHPTINTSCTRQNDMIYLGRTIDYLFKYWSSHVLSTNCNWYEVSQYRPPVQRSGTVRHREFMMIWRYGAHCSYLNASFLNISVLKTKLLGKILADVYVPNWQNDWWKVPSRKGDTVSGLGSPSPSSIRTSRGPWPSSAFLRPGLKQE